MCLTTSNNHNELENSPIELEVLPFIEAAQESYPSKEQLWAEIESDLAARAAKSKVIKSILAISIVALGVWTINPSFYTETYSTNYAERKSLTLADGSLVMLNSNSEVYANIRLRSREIELTRGEASFTVKHELRPFVVKVDQAKIEDIGTVFNIAKWENHFISTVIEGEVEVQTVHGDSRLLAGHSVKVLNGEAGAAYPATLDHVTAWQSGKIMFNGIPLNEAILEMQRYRKQPISLDSRVALLHLTGVYDSNKIEDILDSLPTIFPVKVTHQQDGQIRITKK